MVECEVAMASHVDDHQLATNCSQTESPLSWEPVYHLTYSRDGKRFFEPNRSELVDGFILCLMRPIVE